MVLPKIIETVHLTPEFQLSPIEGLIDLRVKQIMDRADLRADMPTDDHANIQVLVDAAYRAGLRDGVARLGELLD